VELKSANIEELAGSVVGPPVDDRSDSLIDRGDQGNEQS
jgi:hypothetical protein